MALVLAARGAGINRRRHNTQLYTLILLLDRQELCSFSAFALGMGFEVDF